MALIFDTIIAGDPPTGGDTGEQFATKINSNFTKLQNADVATGIALGSGNQTAYGVTNVDAALAMLPNAKWFGKYSQMSGAPALVGSEQSGILTFTTEDIDDLSAINLSTSTSRIVIPNGMTMARFYVSAGLNYGSSTITGGQTVTLVLNKNGVDVQTLTYKGSGSNVSLGEKGLYLSTPLTCTPGDYFQVYVTLVTVQSDKSSISAGAIFGIEGIK